MLVRSSDMAVPQRQNPGHSNVGFRQHEGSPGEAAESMTFTPYEYAVEARKLEHAGPATPGPAEIILHPCSNFLESTAMPKASELENQNKVSGLAHCAHTEIASTWCSHLCIVSWGVAFNGYNAGLYISVRTITEAPWEQESRPTSTWRAKDELSLPPSTRWQTQADP